MELGIDSPYPTTQIKYPQLDIADQSSIKSLVDLVKRDHGSLDVLINNAGVNLENDYSPLNVKKTLDTNYRGTLNVSSRCEIALIDSNQPTRCVKHSYRF